mmetsp:Transcript_16608/g.27229  ORF Transcript_16608/g.27229 Transcript_16608/m.27229 type:complete len:286 (+) Transcript_16608:171-1028(+)
MGCIFSTSSGSASLVTEDGKHKTSAWTEEFKESNWISDSQNIWSRNLSDLSVHMDLPRLGPRITLFHEDNEINFSQPTDTKMERIKLLLIEIAKMAHEDDQLISDLETKFYDHINKDGAGDASQQLSHYLTAIIPKDSKIERVLKLCHQKMVFPAFYCIKAKIFDKLPFKDYRGSWDVKIVFLNDNVLVQHSKIQVSKDTPAPGEEEEFKFRWCLNLSISGDDLGTFDEPKISITYAETRRTLPLPRTNEIKDLLYAHFPSPTLLTSPRGTMSSSSSSSSSASHS